MLSPLSDNNSVHVSSAAEDTWTLSPDPAMGPRRWRFSPFLAELNAWMVFHVL